MTISWQQEDYILLNSPGYYLGCNDLEIQDDPFGRLSPKGDLQLLYP
jgi:hypothetical protein